MVPVKVDVVRITEINDLLNTVHIPHGVGAGMFINNWKIRIIL